MAPEKDDVASALTLNAFTRPGYTFVDWNTKADGTGTSYANGAKYSFSASITLYAQWKAGRFPPTRSPSSPTAESGPWPPSATTPRPPLRPIASPAPATFCGLEHEGERRWHAIRRRRHVLLQDLDDPLRPVDESEGEAPAQGAGLHRHFQRPRREGFDGRPAPRQARVARAEPLHSVGLHLHRLEHDRQRLGHALRQQGHLPLYGNGTLYAQWRHVKVVAPPPITSATIIGSFAQKSSALTPASRRRSRASRHLSRRTGTRRSPSSATATSSQRPSSPTRPLGRQLRLSQHRAGAVATYLNQELAKLGAKSYTVSAVANGLSTPSKSSEAANQAKSGLVVATLS